MLAIPNSSAFIVTVDTFSLLYTTITLLYAVGLCLTIMGTPIDTNYAESPFEICVLSIVAEIFTLQKTPATVILSFLAYAAYQNR